MIDKSLDLAPLTSAQSRDILALKAAYGSFWRDPRFTKGCVEPSFSRNEVEELLGRAAELVVRIRSHLDACSEAPPCDKRRILAGFSGEFLLRRDLMGAAAGDLAAHEYPHPRDNPERFVRDLVHATLMDSSGYVEGLTEDLVNSFIAQIEAYQQLARSLENNGAELYQALQTQWTHLSQLLPQAFGEDAPQELVLNDPTTVSEMRRLIAKLHEVEQIFRAIKFNQLRLTRSPFLDAPGTPFELHAPAVADAPSCPESASSELNDDAPVKHEVATDTDTHSSPVPSPAPTTEAVAAVPETDESTPVTSLHDAPTLNDDAPTLNDDVPTSTPTGATLSVAPAIADLPDDPTPEKEAEEAEEAEAINPEAIIQIQKVAAHVDQVASDFKDVLEQVQPLCADPTSLEQKPIESLREIEKYHSTIVGYSEELLQDLLRLDDIEVDPSARVERKKQVLAIQSLMDDLDGVASKLKNFKNMLKTQVEQLAAAPPSAPSSSSSSPPPQTGSHLAPPTPPPTGTSPGLPAPGSPPATSSSSTPPAGAATESTSPIASMWQKMKLDVKWDRSQTPDVYILRAMIPGLDTKQTKLEVSEDNSHFTIAGVRLPTAKEEAELRRALHMRYSFHPSEENRLLMQVMAGKYGSFKSTFNLPPDAQADRLSAAYERGILQITVPRKHAPPPAPFPASAPRGGPYGYQRRAPAAPRGFWGDRDLWW